MELRQRKHTRLKEYDYSQNGYYYITISTKDNKPILSTVRSGIDSDEPVVYLSPIGEIAEQQLFDLKNRYDYIRIDKYVIMPTHIHFILVMGDKTAAASHRPTLSDVVCTYKSLITRICNKNDNVQGRIIFQASFYEEIIRNQKGYQEVYQYIENNPMKWILADKNLQRQ